MSKAGSKAVLGFLNRNGSSFHLWATQQADLSGEQLRGVQAASYDKAKLV